MALDNIVNYVKWNTLLSSAGQPSIPQFGLLADAGYYMVINLATPDINHAPVEEDFIVSELGIDFVHIPVSWTSPTYPNLDHFFRVMDIYQGKKVFVHCIMNMRATVFLYLYLTLHRDVPEPQAREIMEKVWRPNPVWTRFIETSARRYAG